MRKIISIFFIRYIKKNYHILAQLQYIFTIMFLSRSTFDLEFISSDLKFLCLESLFAAYKHNCLRCHYNSRRKRIDGW